MLKKITIFANINLIEIDKNNDKVLLVEQSIYVANDMKKHLEQAVATVKRYQDAGSYPLVAPTFMDEVIGNFTNGGLSTDLVLQENSYHKIVGFPGCTRVWELPESLKNQVQDKLIGFNVSFDDDSWKILTVEQIKTTT